MADRAFLERLSRELVDQGKLIEAGWVGLRLAAMHPDSPPDQLREMRMAFFAGAQHLFGSIMSILDPGEEPTDDDLKRMDLIDKELKGFIAKFARDHVPTQGTA
jgi:hypothetical protein